MNNAQKENVPIKKSDTMSAMTGALTGRDMKCLDSKALPQSPVRPNLLRSAPKTPSSPRQTRIMRTPSPPVFHLSTMDSVKNSESTSIAVRATSRTTSATYSTNRTGTLDSIANTKQLSSNHHLNRLCGSSVKGGTVLSSHLRSTQATPSLHFKSTSTISTSSMHLSNMAPSSVQKSVCLSSGRFAPSSSVSPPSEIPLCKILPPEWVNKLKLIQNSNKAEEVEDEEEDEVNHQLDQDDDEEDDNMVYRISEEDENDSDLNGQPAHDCTIGTLTDRHHPPVQPRSTVDEQKTLSVPKSVQKSDSCCKIPKVKHGINLLRKVINKPLSKTISEEAIGYRSTSNFATSSSSSVAKIDAGVAATSNNSNHPNLVEKYRKIINLNEANKDRHKEPDRLRQAKSEPDLHSMDLSSATSESANSSKREYQDSIRMYHKHAMKRSESQSELHASKLESIWVKGKEYIVLNMIGQGGSSKVYQVYDAQCQQVFAIKVVDLRKVDGSIRASLRKEIELLSRLRHCRRVVRLMEHEFDERSGRLVLVMEKGDSDLGNILKQILEIDSLTSLDSIVIKFYWKEMLKAVDEIHSNGVVHSDLKPVNFISVGGKLKLIDFGIADAVEANHTSVLKDAQIGTVNFMPPEALTASHTVPNPSSTNPRKPNKNIFKLSYKSDIWSLGCILYNLVYGKPPFGHVTDMYEKITAICDAKHAISFPPTRHQHVVDCLRRCLQRKPQDRPMARELLQHPFLNDDKKLSVHIGKTMNESRSMNTIISQMAVLTPNRLNQLEKIASQLATKK